MTAAGSKVGVGARLRRKEDDRFLHGRGQYVADIRFPRMREVAFVRSPVAHARLTGIRIPDQIRSSVFTAKDLTGVLTAGQFHQTDRMVYGEWTLQKSFLDNLAGM